MMQPDELVAILKGTNTAVVADDEHSAATFFCNFVSRDLARKAILVVYSEIKCGKIEKVIKSKIKNRDVREVIGEIPVVKVGRTNKANFGNLVAYIEENENLREMSRELGAILKKLNGSGDRVAIFAGFELISYLYSPAEIVQAIDELFTYIPDMTKFFIFAGIKKECSKLINTLFDVVIRIQKSKDFDIMAYSRTYDVYVEQSITGGLQPVPLYRIDGEKLTDVF